MRFECTIPVVYVVAWHDELVSLVKQFLRNDMAGNSKSTRRYLQHTLNFMNPRGVHVTVIGLTDNIEETFEKCMSFWLIFQVGFKSQEKKGTKISNILPVHVKPSPSYPSLQSQLYEPLLLMHAAFTWQLFWSGLRHSSTSGGRKKARWLECTREYIYWSKFNSSNSSTCK